MNRNGNSLQSLALRYVALALFGVIATVCSEDPTLAASTPGERPALSTHLYALESESVRLEEFDGSGGAIESMGEDLLVVTPKGRFALVFPDGTAEYLDGNVPMNAASVGQHDDYDNHFDSRFFRVADILLKELGEGSYELFATHHYFTGECIRFRLSSTTIRRTEESVTVMPDWRAIFDAEPCLPLKWFGGHGAGGKLLTDGADHLLVSIGVHQTDLWLARPTSDPASHLGKLLRIAIETGETETLAIGFRNSQGLARDAEGNLWATDQGPQGGDELNLVERGGNYGWPLVSYGVDYEDKVPLTIEDEAMGRHDGFQRPAFAWVPSPAVSAIAVNDERWFPLWKDDLLVASLRAGSLFRVRRHGTDVQYAERIEIGWRIRDLTFMPDGRIALLRDSGWVYFLSRSLRYCNEDAQKQRKVYSVNCEFIAAPSVPAPPDTEYSAPYVPHLSRNLAGAQLFDLHCSACHNLNAEQHGAGPHLVGVIGRRAGEVEGYRFSDAFDSLDVVWTQDSVTQFLTGHRPGAVRPGTSTSSPDIGEAEARAIADYISRLNYLEALVRNREPAIRSDFDVYLGENTLVYVREPCSPADTEAPFFLHLFPVHVNDLPDHREQYGYADRGFGFDERVSMYDGKCLAEISLPGYAISEIRTGQYARVDGDYNNLWEGEIRPNEVYDRDYWKEPFGDNRPVIRSDWDVYLVEDSLIYVRDECSPEDIEPEFFVHLLPVDVNDLPSHRQQHGFDGVNFDFRNHLVIEGGVCVARWELPDFAYAIAAVRTGQFNGDGQIWNGSFDLAGPSGDGQAAPTSVPVPDAAATTSTPAAKTVGLFLNEPEAFDGYTLFNKIRSKTIYLIDNQGRVVRKWELDAESLFAKLLENGNLLTLTEYPDPDAQRSVREIDRNGNILWECAQGSPHHDFLKMPNGNVLLLSRQHKTPEEAIAAGANPEFIGDKGLWAPHIVEARITGPASCEIVWEWSAWDHLIQDFDSSKANYGVVSEHPELIDLNFHLSDIADWLDPSDWIHSNGIDYSPELDQVVLSPRHFSEVWIIDHSTTRAEAAGSSGGNSGQGGDLLYRWGNPRAYRAGTPADQQLFWPHSPQWIPPGLTGAGNILVFNNGNEFPGSWRHYSSVDEIAPPVDGANYRLDPDRAYAPVGPVWTYTAPTPSDFFARFISGAQRLPNGNTLICDGPDSTLFEVTPAGKTVWKYVNPMTSNGPLRQGEPVPLEKARSGRDVPANQVYRAYRYAPDYPGLQGLDLTPGEPIELYPTFSPADDGNAAL